MGRKAGDLTRRHLPLSAPLLGSWGLGGAGMTPLLTARPDPPVGPGLGAGPSGPYNAPRARSGIQGAFRVISAHQESVVFIW